MSFMKESNQIKRKYFLELDLQIFEVDDYNVNAILVSKHSDNQMRTAPNASVDINITL